MTNATENTTAANATEAKVDGRVNNGRKPALADRDTKFNFLVAIRDRDTEKMPSRFIIKQLVDEGVVALAAATVAEGETRGRGRPALIPSLTGKGNSWVKLIERNRAKAEEKAAQAAAASEEETATETESEDFADVSSNPEE